MKSVFGFRVRLGNPDLDFENLNPDFPIERTPRVLGNPRALWSVGSGPADQKDRRLLVPDRYEEYPQGCLHVNSVAAPVAPTPPLRRKPMGGALFPIPAF